MKKTIIILVVLLVSSTAYAEDVRVNCKEYAAMTGETSLPCDDFEFLTVPKADYDTAVLRAKIKACKAKVQSKYSGIDCQPRQLWSKGEDDTANSCYEEMQACEKIDAKSDDTPVAQQKVNLWD
ncbi:hypothetical protein [Maridesulfovibrio sp.]|uniref:hypothetical protein n=1 Tax=Maridesulfovibrio sp. TaxID=2795000 RepID=UPI0029C9D227|nr:hypothetical protein [Maridesulfovibrio sp.]